MSRELHYSSSSEEAVLLDGIAKWLAREISPHASKLEHNDTYPQEMVEQMKEMGLFGATIGQEWGGLGLSASLYAKYGVEVFRVEFIFSHSFMIPFKSFSISHEFCIIS